MPSAISLVWACRMISCLPQITSVGACLCAFKRRSVCNCTMGEAKHQRARPFFASAARRALRRLLQTSTVNRRPRVLNIMMCGLARRLQAAPIAQGKHVWRSLLIDVPRGTLRRGRACLAEGVRFYTRGINRTMDLIRERERLMP